jgi:hypothetical protein
MGSASMAACGGHRQVVAMVALCAAAASGATASAQTTFTSRAAWQAAVRPFVTIDFEGLVPAGASQPFPMGLTVAGVTFKGAGSTSSAPDRVDIVGPAFASYIGVWSSGGMLQTLSLGTDTRGIIHPQPGSISLPAGVTAVGFNYATTCIVVVSPGCEGPWSVRLSTGQLLTIPGSTPPPAMAFWGIVSTVPLTSIQINPGATFFLLDNFSYASVVPVPALAFWAFVALTIFLAAAGVASIRTRERNPFHRG